jgi:protein SCO1/2
MRKTLSGALLTALLFAALPAHAAPLPGLSLYNLSSAWTTERGRQVRLDSFRGHPLVVAMIYLSCPDVCPLIAENMQEIEAALPAKARGATHFALVTFDPARDTEQRLKAYAQAHRFDPSRWTLLRGDESSVRELAAALDVTYRRRDDGNFDHSIAIVLLDDDGVEVWRQTGLSRETRKFASHIEAVAGGQSH